jgi:hypothetical protein
VRTLPSALALLLVLLVLTAPARAQFFGAEPPVVQVGASVLPGVGVQAVYLQPRTVFTIEAALYADTQAPFSSTDERRFQAAAAVGGSVRLLRVAGIVTGAAPGGNLDVGLRAGPGLRFKTDETLADKNQRFRLLFDPFARYVRRVGGMRLFGELGLARPRVRAGIWLAL